MLQHKANSQVFLEDIIYAVVPNFSLCEQCDSETFWKRLFFLSEDKLASQHADILNTGIWMLPCLKSKPGFLSRA